MSRAGTVAVVTDSTATVPPGPGLSVVPLQVVLDGRSLAEGVDVGPDRIAQALRAGRSVTTSRPAPAELAASYRRLAEAGHVGVVSVHLSGDLSGTVSAARAAAAEVAGDVPVRVVDSRSLGLGLGFAALAAQEVAATGADLELVAEAAARTAWNSQAWICLDTLDHLRRGGRISAAGAMLSSALSVKAILVLDDGRLELLDRVRTGTRARQRLVEIAVAVAASRAVDVGVHHLGAADRAAELAEVLRAQVPGLRRLRVAEVGAVIGAHAGPGMVAVVVSPVLPPSAEGH